LKIWFLPETKTQKERREKKGREGAGRVAEIYLFDGNVEKIRVCHASIRNTRASKEGSGKREETGREIHGKRSPCLDAFEEGGCLLIPYGRANEGRNAGSKEKGRRGDMFLWCGRGGRGECYSF